MNKWMMLVLVFSSFAQAEHPNVRSTPNEVTRVSDYKMVDVNKQGDTRVQRFVDTVDGHKVLCYFTDSTYVGRNGTGGIHCMLLDQ